MAMVVTNRLSCVVVALLLACSRPVESGNTRGEQTPVRAELQQKQSNALKFLKAPVTEQEVNDFVNMVRRLLREAKSPSSLEQRNAYVIELVQVLERFVVKTERRDSLTLAEKQSLWLSDPTAARVIRLLGDLNAVEAAETISDYLGLPSDVEYWRLTAGEDMPTTWALFQLGDASLPFLRRKMTSDNGNIRLSAAHAAGLILGPRAEEQLGKWIQEAETAEQRERLAENKTMFQAFTANAERLHLRTPEQYRRARLEEARRTLEPLLDQPSVLERMRQKAKQGQAKPKPNENR
jgi:hypothetical protein